MATKKTTKKEEPVVEEKIEEKKPSDNKKKSTTKKTTEEKKPAEKKTTSKKSSAKETVEEKKNKRRAVSVIPLIDGISRSLSCAVASGFHAVRRFNSIFHAPGNYDGEARNSVFDPCKQPPIRRVSTHHSLNVSHRIKL